MAATLLQTKLYRPVPRPDLVTRPRLFESLDRCLQPGGKLALVSAPAGSGKTTLVAAWLERHLAAYDERVACWLSLDDGDNDPARFLAYLIAALGPARPGIGEAALSLLRGPQLPPTERFLTLLINDIDDLVSGAEPNGRPLVLALDDLHVIQEAAVHEALAYLLDHLPGHMRLVLISRTEPPLPLARLRGRGQLVTVGSDGLRFTQEEARLFLNRVMGLALDEDAAAALTAQTEGWVAGLQMAALALSAQPPTEPGPALAGRQFIMDYLLVEVLRNQPPELEAFLLRTAVLERLCAPLCDALTGGRDGQATLAELQRRNLFLFPLDHEGRWFRYHHLFAELLRQRLAQEAPELIARLHSVAASWFWENGQTGEAIHHALAAGEVEQAAGFVEIGSDFALMHSQFETVSSWLGMLPDEAIQARPRLAAYRAFLSMIGGRSLAEIEAILRTAEVGDRPGQPVSGEAVLIRAILALLQGDIEGSITLSQKAKRLVPEDVPFMRSLVLRNLGSVYSMTGDAAAGAEILTEAIVLAERAADKTGQVIALNSLARLRVLQGRLRASEELLQRALAIATDRRGLPLPVAARALASLSDVKREWNELAEAVRLARDSLQIASDESAFWNMGAYLMLGRALQAQRDFTAAEEALEKAREMAILFDASDMDDRTVEIYLARLWLARGDIQRAAAWAGDSLSTRVTGPKIARPGEMAGWYLVWEMEQALLARLRLTQDRPVEARDILEPLLAAALGNDRLGAAIEARALLAMVYEALGDGEVAQETLLAALLPARTQGYVRLFVDEGRPMAALLRQVPAGSPVSGYARNLLAAFDTFEAGLPDAVDQSSDDLPEPLSERELEVLRWLPSHLTTLEIAAELQVSANTVRFHIKNIYSKLGVHSRGGAVEMARERRLL